MKSKIAIEQHRFLQALTQTSKRAFVQAILPAGDMRSEEAVEVYRNQYNIRLCRYLEGAYASVKKYFGTQKFAKLSKEYLLWQKSPADDFTVWAKDFGAFLQRKTGKKLFRELCSLEELTGVLLREKPPNLSAVAPLGGSRFSFPKTIFVKQFSSFAVKLFHPQAMRNLSQSKTVSVLFSRQSNSASAYPLKAWQFEIYRKLRSGQTLQRSIAGLATLRIAEKDVTDFFALLAMAGVDVKS